MFGKVRLSNLHFVWGTSGSKNLLDQVSAFRPSHFDVHQAVYLSQPPFSNSNLFFEHLIIEGKFKSDQGLRSPLVPVKVVYVLQPPFLFLFLAYTQKWFNTLKILVDFVSRRVD